MDMDTIWLVLYVIFAVVSVVVCPYMTIQAMNIIFHMNIQFTYSTWWAALWLSMLAGGGIKWRKHD